MLLPQFTIRNLLILTAICAVISMFVRQALFGVPWAIGVSMGIAFVAGTFLIHAFLTLTAGLPAYGWQRLAEDHTPAEDDSSERPPQQIIAQREGD
jgi:hypothetical protein